MDFYGFLVTCKLFLVYGKTAVLEVGTSTSVSRIIRQKVQCQCKCSADRVKCLQTFLNINLI